MGYPGENSVILAVECQSFGDYLAESVAEFLKRVPAASLRLFGRTAGLDKKALRDTRLHHVSEQSEHIAKDSAAGALVGGGAEFIMRMRAREKKIARPPVAIMLPRRNGEAVLLDIGGASQNTESDLQANAELGCSIARCVLGARTPRVCAIKAGAMSPPSFFEYAIGASRMHDCDCDVLVTDGHSGSTIIGAWHAAAGFLSRGARAEFQKIVRLFMQAPLILAGHDRAIVSRIAVKDRDSGAWALELASQLARG